MYHFFSEFDDGVILRRFLVVELPAGHNLLQLFEDIYRLIQPQDRHRISIVIRPAVKNQLNEKIVSKLFSSKKIDLRKIGHRYADLLQVKQNQSRFFKRFKSFETYILGSDNYRHFLSSNINPFAKNHELEFEEETRKGIIRNLQKDEIDYLVKIGKCKFPPLANTFYKVPSGRYVKSFLRVGNLQTSRSAIDAIFFWLLPYLNGCRGIVTDTWTISSISQTISRRLAVYDTKVIPPQPIEMLPKYHSNSEAFALHAANLIDTFLDRIHGDEAGKVLILLSATHTGSLAGLLEKYLEIRGVNESDLKYVSLFRLSDASNIPTLRDYSYDDDFLITDGDKDDASDSVVEIDGQNHFPLSEISIEKTIPIKAIEAIRDIVSPYAMTNFVKIHYTDGSHGGPGQQRHHMVWIDTLKLFKTRIFIDKFMDKLGGIHPPPKLIIFPDHEPARFLAKIATDQLNQCGYASESFCHNNLKINSELSQNDRELSEKLASLDENDSVLLLDDAYITGKRITTYQQQIRDSEFKGRLHYLVGVARPDNSSIWNRQKRAFIRADAESGALNTFSYIEKIVLPNWSTDACPWCAELRAHKEQIQTNIGRIEALSKTQDGMSEGLFLIPKDEGDIHLKSGSFFGPFGLNQAILFLMTSHLIQGLRNGEIGKGARLGDDNFMINAVLDKTVYTTFFTDAVLRAAVFRASTPKELVYSSPAGEKNRTQILEDYLMDDTYSDIAPEIIYAVATKKIPNLNLSSERISNRVKSISLIDLKSG